MAFATGVIEGLLVTDEIQGAGAAAANLWATGSTPATINIGDTSTTAVNIAVGAAASTLTFGDATSLITTNGSIYAGSGVTTSGVDRAGALSIGTTTATSITIGPSSNSDPPLVRVPGGLLVTPNATNWQDVRTLLGIDQTITIGPADSYFVPFALWDTVSVSSGGNSIYHMDLTPTTTISGGVTPDVASLSIAAPGIALSGGAGVTTAYSLYISSAPTQASTNYALYVATGNTRIATFDCATPSGLYAYLAAPYTTVSSASGGLELPVSWTEQYDPRTHFTVNYGSNGRWRYTGALTRLFSFTISWTVSSTVAAAILTTKLQRSTNDGSTWGDVAGGEADRYLSGVNDEGCCSFTVVDSVIQNAVYRILLDSTNASTRYTFNHLSITINQMV